MQNLRIAVLGLGRSGLAVARAAQRHGGQVTVYDAKPGDDRRIAPFVEVLAAEGIPFVGQFEGPFTDVDMLVTSPGVDMRKPILQNAASSGIEVIGEVEFAYRISKAPIIAITGTNGKSTTTVMTYLALRAAAQDAVLCGNIYGSGYDEVPLTEAALNSQSHQVLVAEISSFQLEWTRDFRPRCAGVTNITPDHLNRYDSFDQYAQTKRKLFDRMGEGDTIVANAGDPETYPSNDTLRDRGTGLPRVRFYSTAGPDASFDSHSLKLSVNEPVENFPFTERHNFINACHASLLALSYLEGVGAQTSPTHTVAKVLEGIRSFKGLAHRMEHVGHKNGIELINNSMCTNPAAVVASSSSLGAPQHLLMGGIKKEYDFAPVREHLVKKGHEAYLFGRDAQQIHLELGDIAKVFDTMEEAFLAATDKAVPGDVIMLAPGCASMDQFDDFVARGERFREIAKEWLSNETDS
jgi:UDP-N-acetylmuramoylalanine--D-glutamate ligase